ncbi:hypothetical protein BH10PSE6_BH10PSE6_34530 [soil metagenome]
MRSKGITDQVTAAKARQEFKKCVSKVRDGSPIEILHHGQPVVCMVPVEAGRALKSLHGLFQDGASVTLDGHIFTDLTDMANYLYFKKRFASS